MKSFKIIIQTDTGESIELQRLEDYLTRLSKGIKKSASPQEKEANERTLSCYLQALRELTKTDLQILWYIKNMPLRKGLNWALEEILRKQYESGWALKTLGEKENPSPFPRV